MKTPEELAEKYLEQDKVACDAINHAAEHLVKDAFLAGYQAAKDTYKDAISTYEEVAKQMMEEAVRIMSPKNEVADASKVMNSPKKLDSWISVKERLPEIEQSSFAMRKESACVLIASNGKVHVAHLCEKWCDRTQLIFEACDCDCRGHDMEQDEWELNQVTHWMPIPEAPKEEYA